MVNHLIFYRIEKMVTFFFKGEMKNQFYLNKKSRFLANLLIRFLFIMTKQI